MFQIWTTATKNAYMLIDGITAEEAKALEAEGCQKIQDLKAPDGGTAQREFVDFCELYQPGNTIERTERIKMLGIAEKFILKK